MEISLTTSIACFLFLFLSKSLLATKLKEYNVEFDLLSKRRENFLIKSPESVNNSYKKITYSFLQRIVDAGFNRPIALQSLLENEYNLNAALNSLI